MVSELVFIILKYSASQFSRFKLDGLIKVREQFCLVNKLFVTNCGKKLQRNKRLARVWLVEDNSRQISNIKKILNKCTIRSHRRKIKMSILTKIVLGRERLGLVTAQLARFWLNSLSQHIEEQRIEEILGNSNKQTANYVYVVY